MLTQYHIEIMLQALGERFSPRAMSTIIHANINQDRLSGMFGHDEYHFDNNAFAKTYTYIEEQRALTISSLQAGDVPAAWCAFGRFLHSTQDFYAHSNYITLWLNRFDYSPRDEVERKGQTPPPPPEVDPLDQALIHSPDLRSGIVYFPLDWLYFVKRLRPYVLRIIPRNSHAWMNLDTPEQGIKFDYAMHAAIKRTVFEYEKTTQDFTDTMCRLFLDKGDK